MSKQVREADIVAAARTPVGTAEAGNLSTLSGMGMLYEEGMGVEPELQRAFSYSQSAPDRGDGRAQTGVARIHQCPEGGVPVIAAAEPVHIASLDTRDNLYQEGMMYFEGRSVPKNYGKARRIWKRASGLNHVPSMYALGILYFKGQGGAVNKRLAISYIRRAAEKGYDLAQLQMGWLHLQKDSDIYSRMESSRWLKLAAAQGNEQAQDLLIQHGLQDVQINKVISSQNFQELLAESEEDAFFMASDGWEKAEIEAYLKDQGCTPKVAAEAVRRAMSQVRAERRKNGLVIIGLGAVALIAFAGLVLMW